MRERKFDSSNTTALPDIDRIKGNYLDCYFAIIEAIRSYTNIPTEKALHNLRDNMIVLTEELEEELTKEEKKQIIDITHRNGYKHLSFQELYKVWGIMKHRMKLLRITDIKMRDGVDFNFK